MLSRKTAFNSAELAVSCLLMLAVVLVFGQTIRHDFINLDDPEYVYANPIVAGGLTVSGIARAFTEGYQSLWVPLTWISLMADWELYNVVYAGGYHLTNVLLHGATAIVLFLALLRMTNRLWPCALAAAIFAVHPLRVESVAWVTERKDVLSGLCFSLALLAYAGYARRPSSWGRYALVAAALALGLMAKPMLVTVPFVLLLLDYWPLGRLAAAGGVPDPVGASPPVFRPTTPARLVIEKIPLLALSAGSAIITMAVQDQTLLSAERFSPLWRIGNTAISYVTYVEMFLFPVNLIPVYLRLGTDLPAARLVISVSILLGVTAAAVLMRRRSPYLLVGWLWYLGMMLPVIGLIQVGLTAVADRFTYLPQIGLTVALVWGAADLCRFWSIDRRACGLASALVLILLMGMSFRQASFWSNSETLWNHTLELSPDNFVAHNNLGNELALEGRLREAVEHFRQSLASVPQSVVTLINMGDAYVALGEPNEAAHCYEEALKVDPNQTRAHDRLGVLLANQDRLDEAIEHFEKSLQVASGNSETQFDLAQALARRGRADESKLHFEQGMALNPDYANQHNMLGEVAGVRRLPVEAIEHFQRALYVDPNLVRARLNLAMMLALSGRPDEAMAEYRTVLKTAPDNAQAKAAIAALEKEAKKPKAVAP